MKRILLFLLAMTGLAHATVWNVNSSQSVATIQGVITTNAAVGDTVAFAAGTYNISSALNIKCGVTYTGPAVTIPANGIPTSQTAILNNTQGTQGTIFSLSNQSCSQNTVIQYLNFHNEGFGISFNAPWTNALIQFNYFSSIACDSSCSGNETAGISMGSSTPLIYVSGVTIQWNQIGDSSSCPVVVFEGGQCEGIGTGGSLNNITILHNNLFHLGEAIHIACPSYNNPTFECEPAPLGGSQGGAVTTNITAQYNDFNQIHRIPWEEQPQQSSGVFYQYNSEHDWLQADYASFGVSFACCSNGIHDNPNPVVTDNLIMFNQPYMTGRYGYGMEAMGYGQTYSHNMVQSAIFTAFAQGIAWGNGGAPNLPTSGYDYTFNYVCGTWDRGPPNSLSWYISTEGTVNSGYTPTLTGNNLIGSCAASTSVAPTISPAGGAASFPLTVTLTDAGYGNTTALARGNTGIWYTTDGSNPVPGAGTAQYLSSGGTFVLNSAATVKAVGMWGARNQPTSYASGFGFTPSAVVSAAYAGGGPPTAATPVLAPTSQTFSGTLSVSIADSTPNSAIYYTTDGATPVAGPGGVIIGTQYYVSPTGSDSNNGTSPSTPWLSPNHAVNCGDVLNAAAGTYSTINFTAGKWGTVTCTSGNNVAWLKCSTFDTCKISSTTADAMWVDKSFWGVQGWEASTNGSSNNEAACFRATPSGAYVLHHLVFANNIANGCQGGGFISFNTSTTASTDYLTLVGNIAYNAAQGAGECFSGFSIYQPLNSDTVAGTHLFMGGNFAFGNVDPSTCAGGPPTDGEGFNFDTLDHSQGGGAVYTGQAVAENNVSVFNGGKGYEAENNNAGSTHANIFFKNNTSYGNSTDPNQTTGCFDRGELNQQNAQNVTWTNNLAQTRNGTSCSGEPLYGFTALPPATGSTINGSWWLGISGHNTDPNTPSFVLGTGNTIGTSPAFTNPVQPGVPSCSGTASVPACMATVIANYTPTVSGSTTLGYQTPSPDAVSDPLFPQWLCNVNLPAGLISSACSPIYTGPLTLSTTTTVQAIAAAPTFVNSSVASGTYTVSTPILTGGAQTNAPLVNTLTVGAPAVQQFAVGNYSDGVNRNLPDGFGNTPVWTSSAPTILQVTSAGLVSCLAPGTANSQVKSAPGGIVFNVWGWTCNAATSTVATPVLTPATENFSGTISVSISTTTAGATIHYTTDGSTPTATSPTYTGPLSIVATTVVKALGVLAGDNPSAVATATYTQVAATISSVTLSVIGSTFVNYVLVGGTANFQATIHYSDGVTLNSTTVGVANARGDSISSWTTSSSMVGTITTGGVMSGAALGVTSIQAIINGTVDSNPWFEYVSKSITTNVAGVTARGVNIQ